MRASLLLAPVVVCIAACSGGSSSNNGVASLGSSQTAHSTTTTVKVSIESATRLYDQWAACIRSHGVDLQDPTVANDGTVNITLPPNTPQATFQAADQACQALHSAARAADGAPTTKPDPTALRNFSKCMRAHGIADFPDPSSGGGVRISVNGNAASDLSPDNPAFQSAQKACQTYLPNQGHGGERVSQTNGGPGGGPGPVSGPPGGSGSSSGPAS